MALKYLKSSLPVDRSEKMKITKPDSQELTARHVSEWIM